MGERSLQRLLIVGTNSVILKRQVHAAARPGSWLARLLPRKPPMLVRVALANSERCGALGPSPGANGLDRVGADEEGTGTGLWP
jgi:hypothetical protein